MLCLADIVTDLFDCDLSRIVSSDQELSDEHCQYFMYQLLCGLQYVHSANILHRDLKPSNLLVTSDCRLAVCDFGLSRGKAKKGNFMTEYVVTRYYRAPELLCENRDYDEKVDVWSAGLIFAEMLTGRVLLQGKNAREQLQLIVKLCGAPDPEEDMSHIEVPGALDVLRKLSLKYPKGLDFIALFQKYTTNRPAIDLLRRMLVFNPAKRISVADALRHPFLSNFQHRFARHRVSGTSPCGGNSILSRHFKSRFEGEQEGGRGKLSRVGLERSMLSMVRLIRSECDPEYFAYADTVENDVECREDCEEDEKVEANGNVSVEELRVLFVGLVCVDIVMEVDRYPEEDGECRALMAPRRARGGNAANAAVVASQLGVSCELLCSLTENDDDGAGEFVRNDLKSFGVSLSSFCPRHNDGTLPISHVIVGRKRGTRTIVHHRSLPELSVANFVAAVAYMESAKNPFQGIHFEGRDGCAEMIRHAREKIEENEWETVLSLEIEKPKRRNLLDSLHFVDVAFFSREFIEPCNFGDSAESAVQNVATHLRSLGKLEAGRPRALVCTWGSLGASVLVLDHSESKTDRLLQCSAQKPRDGVVVDTLGAGDTFIGIFLAKFIRDGSYEEALGAASALSGAKVGVRGFVLPLSPGKK